MKQKKNRKIVDSVLIVTEVKHFYAALYVKNKQTYLNYSNEIFSLQSFRVAISTG